MMKKYLLNYFYKERAFQMAHRFMALLTVCRAIGEHDEVAQRLETALNAAAAIQARDPVDAGYQGEQLRAALDQRRAAAIDRIG